MLWVRFLWAGPNTLLGLLLGGFGLLTGAKCRRCGRMLEFWGGWLTPVLQRSPFLKNGIAAITFGHVVIGQSATILDACRDHEYVHVQQYERWGPFFLPAYFAASIWQGLRGKDPYRDNPFEVEAYEHSDPSNP